MPAVPSELVVGVERVDSRRYVAENGSVATDPAGTDVWLYYVEPRSGLIVPRGGGRLDRSVPDRSTRGLHFQP